MPTALDVISSQPPGQLTVMAAALVSMAKGLGLPDLIVDLISSSSSNTELSGAARNMWAFRPAGAARLAVSCELQTFVTMLQTNTGSDLPSARQNALKPLAVSVASASADPSFTWALTCQPLESASFTPSASRRDFLVVSDETLLCQAARSGVRACSSLAELRSFQEGVIAAINQGLQEDDAWFCEGGMTKPNESPRKRPKTMKPASPHPDSKRARPPSPEQRDGLLPFVPTPETSLVSIAGLRSSMDVTAVSVALTRLMECPVYLTPADLVRTFGVIRVTKEFAAAMFPPRTTQRKYLDPSDRWEVMIQNCKADGLALQSSRTKFRPQVGRSPQDPFPTGSH